MLFEAIVVLEEERRCVVEEKKQRMLKIAALMKIRMTLRTRHYLTSSVLISPSASPWSTTYSSRDDAAFFNLVSLPVHAYEQLLAVFVRHYHVRSGPGRKGRPTRMQNPNNILACLLHFYSAASFYVGRLAAQLGLTLQALLLQHLLQQR